MIKKTAFILLLSFFMCTTPAAPPQTPAASITVFPIDGPPMQVLTVTEHTASNGTKSYSSILITDKGDAIEQIDFLDEAQTLEFMEKLTKKHNER